MHKAAGLELARDGLTREIGVEVEQNHIDAGIGEDFVFHVFD